MASTSKKIKDVYTKGAHLLYDDASVEEVAKEMQSSEVGFIPIGNKQDDKLHGTITDRDIVLKVVAQGKDASKTKAGEIMSGNLVYALEEDTLERASDLMSKHQIRRLPVLNSEKRLTGVVSLGDLAERESGLAQTAHSKIVEDRT